MNATPHPNRLRTLAAAVASAVLIGLPAIVCAQAGNVNTGAFDPFADSRRLEGMQGIPDTYKVYGSLGEDYTVAVDANTGDILVYDALNQTGVNTTSVEGKQLIQELSDLNRVAITMSPEEQENLASYTQATVAAMMGTGDVGDMLDARSQFGLSNGPGTAVAGAQGSSGAAGGAGDGVRAAGLELPGHPARVERDAEDAHRAADGADGDGAAVPSGVVLDALYWDTGDPYIYVRLQEPPRGEGEECDVVIVGSGAGGLIGWTTAAFHPRLVRRLVVLAAPHPLRLRAGIFADPRGQFAAATPTLKFQIPRYEHVLTRDDAALIGYFLRRWGGPDWVASAGFDDYAARCREAMRIPQAAFCALEGYRWAFRSVLRLHGYRFVRLMQQPLVTPTLQLHGAADEASLPRTAQGSSRYVSAQYEWRLLDRVGHFPHVECPDLVLGEVLRWAKS